MISFTTTARVMQAIRRSHDVEFCSYVLHSRRMIRTLECAARRGSHVGVQLEAHPYADTGAQLARSNRDATRELRRAGVDAQLVDRSACRANHMKAAVVDGVAFLDDRNWAVGGHNSIIADDDARDIRAIDAALHGEIISGNALAVTKGASLKQEAAVLFASRMRREVSLETESFTAGTAPYVAMKSLARHGVHVRLLLCKDDSKTPMLAAARALARDGVDVRLTHAAEKFAIAGQRGWIGSANATFGQADQIDWGMRIENRRLCRELQSRFDSTWRRAAPLMA